MAASETKVLHKSHAGFYTGRKVIQDATAVANTSDAIDIRRMEEVSLIVATAAMDGRTFTVEIEVSDDGDNWMDYNMLINNLTNDAGDGTAGEEVGLTRIETQTFTTNTRTIVGLDLKSIWAPFIRIVVARTVEGNAGTISTILAYRERS